MDVPAPHRADPVTGPFGSVQAAGTVEGGRVTDVGRRGRHEEVRYDALVLADAEPVLHVHHTALYRLSGAA